MPEQNQPSEAEKISGKLVYVGKRLNDSQTGYHHVYVEYPLGKTLLRHLYKKMLVGWETVGSIIEVTRTENWSITGSTLIDRIKATDGVELALQNEWSASDRAAHVQLATIRQGKEIAKRADDLMYHIGFIRAAAARLSRKEKWAFIAWLIQELVG